MAKYAKWLGGTIGWALGGPLGGILGFALGSLLDEAEVTVRYGQTTSSPSSINDFTASLIVLSAAVMKSDGKVMRSELDYVKRFFIRQFGEAKAKESILLLREILNKEIPLHDVCLQIKRFMPLASRLQLVHYLFGIANADGELHPDEISIIEQIARYLGIASADFGSIRAMYLRDDEESDYKILEINPTATNEEVKKAYRRMALRFHPDRVAQEGEDVQRAASEKFKKVQQAYENIKKKRGMS
jgi:DnaJ like chaperone protein